MIVKRIDAGIYNVNHNGADYELERYPDGSWLLFSKAKNDNSPREYMNDFATRREALDALA